MKGSLQLNGVDDHQLETIIEVKQKYEPVLMLQVTAPQEGPVFLQPPPGITPPPPGSAPEKHDGDNIVTLVWEDRHGLNAITEILFRLYPDLPVPPFA